MSEIASYHIPEDDQGGVPGKVMADINFFARLAELEKQRREAKKHPEKATKPAPQPAPTPRAKVAARPKRNGLPAAAWAAAAAGLFLAATLGTMWVGGYWDPETPAPAAIAPQPDRPAGSLPEPTPSLVPTATPTPAPPVQEPAPQPVSGRTYVVKTGDTLITIGEQVGKPWQEIAAANGIGPPYVIYNGNVLRIP